MGGQVIQNDNIAGLEGRQKYLFDMRLENIFVDSSVNYHTSG
jgi:hypothetical protein